MNQRDTPPGRKGPDDSALYKLFSEYRRFLFSGQSPRQVTSALEAPARGIPALHMLFDAKSILERRLCDMRIRRGLHRL